MRHFLLSGPVMALPLRMGVTTPQARLVTLSGCTNRSSSCLSCARYAAVAVTTIAVAANQYGCAAAGT